MYKLIALQELFVYHKFYNVHWNLGNYLFYQFKIGILY